MQFDNLIGNDLIYLFHVSLMQPPEDQFYLVAPEPATLALGQTILDLARSSA